MLRAQVEPLQGVSLVRRAWPARWASLIIIVQSKRPTSGTPASTTATRLLTALRLGVPKLSAALALTRSSWLARRPAAGILPFPSFCVCACCALSLAPFDLWGLFIRGRSAACTQHTPRTAGPRPTTSSAAASART